MHTLHIQRRSLFRRNDPESGQTILLVALAIVSLLGMAALAIDVVTLYVARSEIQRAADAAALAGAKAVADSGFTTLPTSDPNYTGAKTLANTMATQAIAATVGTNLVSGGAPVQSGFPVVDSSRQGDVLVTVSLVRSGLPTFFSKIFGRSAATVTATATAEAYNPSNNASFTPIAPVSLKPWLVANNDPTHSGAPFIDKGTGIVENGAIGNPFDLTADCTGIGGLCAPGHTPGILNANQVEYVPLQVTANSKNVCPSCLGATAYENSIECADVNTYVVPSCRGGVTNAFWDNSVIPGGLTGLSASGAECLIHATGTGSTGQDILSDPLAWPLGPRKITTQFGQSVTTSNSIVTIPIIDPASFDPAGPVTVVGYMQAFINQVENGTNPNTSPGDINITVLNISGCSVSPNGAAAVVGGAGTSPVPVRLITPP